jgi:uncharacterized protein YhaN
LKIHALQIDGYGVWSNLKVERFSDGLNVLYGPNEAGKTTLLQFIRSMLYGYSDSRRRYFPPVHGGKPGGMLDVDSPQGRYEIARYWDANEGEQTVLTAADGARQGGHLVKAMLAEIDEETFNNVFAVELREMQELGALSDTAAAELLYNLTAGLDRVSLAEVLRELENSRNRILDADGKPCLVASLQAEREKHRAAIDELGGLTRRFGCLAGERAQLDRELSQFEEERTQVERQARTVELALSLFDRFTRRAEIDAELAALGPASPLPERMLARLDALNARLEKHRRRMAELHDRRGQLRTEAAGIRTNDDLMRQAARIEALAEQEPWLSGLKSQIDELEAEIARLDGEFSGEREQLGLSADAFARMANLSPRSLAALRAPAKTLRLARETLETTQTEAKGAEDASESLAKEIAASLAARGGKSLNEAMDEAGRMVSQYRRRLQIDERLDQLARHSSELDEQNRRAVERQLLPTWVLAALGTTFALGVVLVAMGLVVSPLTSGGANWITAVLGIVFVAGTVVGKMRLEKANSDRLDAGQKQLALVQAQVKQAKEERDELDARLPRGGGPLAVRLDSAEKDLHALEDLVPLETRRNAAVQTASAALERAVRAEEDHKAARRKWREALTAAGLPGELTASQVKRIAANWSATAENQRRLGERREELGRRRKEWDSLASRLVQVAADANVPLIDGDPLDNLKRLSAALAEEQAAAARRNAAGDEIKQLRQLRARHQEAVGQLKHKRRSLFFEAGAENEEQFRERVSQAVRAEALRRERETLCREIATAIGKQCTEEAIGELLKASASIKELQLRGDLYAERFAVLESQLRERLEKRGQLSAQIQALADDRQLPRLQLEMAAVEKRIDEAIGRWRILAVTCRLLESIRESYERERQPETLKEASGYLARLTQGRYVRVWTPLGEKTLRVDDSEGHSLPVESLSRGTREQLFLSLRLALAASFARRGAALPMVLDDVLVNFDTGRATAAAELLRDFAARGHQLLVCTCHEHIEAIFARLDASPCRLPIALQSEGAVVSFGRAERVEEPKREKVRPPRKKPVKEKIEEVVPPPPPVEEIVEPPAKKPSRAKKTPPKPPAKPHGVFDVDFFEEDKNEPIAEEEEDIESEEIEEEDLEEDESLWDEEELEEEFEEEDEIDDEDIEAA